MGVDETEFFIGEGDKVFQRQIFLPYAKRDFHIRRGSQLLFDSEMDAMVDCYALAKRFADKKAEKYSCSLQDDFYERTEEIFEELRYRQDFLERVRERVRLDGEELNNTGVHFISKEKILK